MRVLRAGIAIWAFTQAYQTSEWMLFALGSIFALQAIFDVSCCGASGCTTPPASVSKFQRQKDSIEEVTFEEVK